MTTGVVVEFDAPAASGPTSREPSSMSDASRPAFAERYHSVRDGAAAPPPLFAVISVMVTVSPSPATAGTTRLDTVRSGPMRIGPAARTLLVSSVSTSALPASAFAMMKYEPTAVSGGIVSGVAAGLDAFGASAGTSP